MDETKKTFPWIFVLSVFFAAIVFIADLLIPLGVAAGVPYVALVLISMWSPQNKPTIIAAIAGTILTILGFFFSPLGGILWMIFINRFLAIFAIWVAAILILARKRGDEVLLETEEFSSNLLENSPTPILVVNEDTSIKHVNPALEQLTGYTSAEIIGRKAPYPWWFGNPKSGNLSDRQKSIHKGVSGLERLHRKKNGEDFWIELTVTPIIRNEKYKYTLTSWVDITARKQAEEALRGSEERYRLLVETMNNGLAVRDQSDLLTYVNDTLLEMLGYSKDEMIGRPVGDFFDEVNREIHREQMTERRKGGQEPYEIVWKKKDGTKLTSLMSPQHLLDTRGDYRGSFSVITDITERKRIEEQIKKSLREKAVLLGEVYHRVKNNMQLVASLLSLQAETVKEKQYADMFKESRDRVRSMAQIHEKLYQSEDLANVDFKGYVKSLANTLFRAYAADPNKIRLQLEIKDVSLGLKTAIPCGLLINELLTNSLKYAFTEEREGEIRISIRPVSEDTVELIFSDNGVGIPGDLDIKTTDSFGMFLINVLAEDQLGGKIKLDRTGGTKFVIQLKRQE